MYIEYNANPDKHIVGDCVIRAIAKATNTDWEFIYADLCVQGLIMHDLPSSNNVWGTYLLESGFTRFDFPKDCPKCYTVKDFVSDYDRGVFVLGTGTHAIAAIDGRYYDTWDSGDEAVMYAFRKEKK